MMTKETEMNSKENFADPNRYLSPLRKLSYVVTSIIVLLPFFDFFPLKISFDDQNDHFSFENRFQLTIQLIFLDLIPLVLSIISVIQIRMKTIAVNPLDPRGHPLVEKRQRILQNTLEQLILKLIISLTLATILRPNEFIFLPIFTFLFLLGRFTFAVGYPFYRGFGMAMNAISGLFFILFIFYRIFTEKTFLHSIQWKSNFN